MTPKEIQTKLNEAVMNIQSLQDELDALKSNLSEKPNSSDHLLPEGYEFCTEEEAEKWVKVEMLPEPRFNLHKVGHVMSHISELAESYMKTHYRPIRPIQYHVAVHEAVTAEPDPYQVDWEKAPEGTVGHAYRAGGAGYWYCIDLIGKAFLTSSTESGLVIPDGLDWKKSLRLNPKLK